MALFKEESKILVVCGLLLMARAELRNKLVVMVCNKNQAVLFSVPSVVGLDVDRACIGREHYRANKP